MKTWIVICGALAVVPLYAAAQTAAPNQVERSFAPGGRIFMDLSAGDYTIRGGTDETLRVRWEARNEADLKQVEAQVEVKASDGTIRVRGPKNNFRVHIDVPARSDLTINLSAGDLTVKGITGNKVLDMWAGDVTIAVGDGADYREVETSVRFGEITATPFGKNTGGIFRSFSWQGSGPYALRAKLFAGDLKLVK